MLFRSKMPLFLDLRTESGRKPDVSWSRQAREYPLPMIHPAFGHFPSEGRGTTAFWSLILHSSSRTILKSSPFGFPDVLAPSTFSQIAYRGNRRSTSAPLSVVRLTFRISLIILTASINKPLRSPSSPALLPATDKSWP